MVRIKELVINFHMTEACNYNCGYCYATWNNHCARNELHRHTGKVDSLLDSLAQYFFSDNSLQTQLNYSSVRINFAGGEPMLLGSRFVNALTKARQLGFNTSIITNAHFLDDAFLFEYSADIDMLGISFDTAEIFTAANIGRMDRKEHWLNAESLIAVSQQYRHYNPNGVLKVNTVVNKFNYLENMTGVMAQVSPEKWKILRVLPVHDEQFTISNKQYHGYLKRHSALNGFIVEEDNKAMLHSYLMINPEGKFYQNGEAGAGYLHSESILDIGVARAIKQVPFDCSAFSDRYDADLMPASS
jgi:radical S-adenosyl methionine domain-containing protein 2